jgi:phosphoglycolate phosphatase-like HAD superfamily hydrolase
VNLEDYFVVFWDFDGVIKESLNVKTKAFVKLFEEYGVEITNKIGAHHLANGGMSRFEKFPLYASWVGLTLTSEQIDEYSRKFKLLAFEGVVNAPWVAGVEEVLRNKPENQFYILVSATPQSEIEEIVAALNIGSCFMEIHGSPLTKREAIMNTLKNLNVPAEDCLMIGDAQSDFDAATGNGIKFLLREHETNGHLFADYDGPTIRDFLSI